MDALATSLVFPGGEAWADLRKRADHTLDRIATATGGRTTVVVTHLGVILATLVRVLAIGDDEAFQLTVPHGSIWTFAVTDGADLRPVHFG